MPYSMTGFARAASAGEQPVSVTIRGVNHRFLDLKIRSPQELEGVDALVRRVVKKHVRRGALQVSINLEGRRETNLELNRELADAYLAAYGELAEKAGVTAPPDLTNLLRIPGIISSGEAADDDVRKTLEAELEQALETALTAFNAERSREGAGVADDIRGRTRSIADEVAALSKAAAGMVPHFRDRLEKRLNELLGDSSIDPQRVVQEAAVLAERTDVSEELQRLASHCQRLLALLDSGGEIGKKADFLAQELNREANTLLSKCTPLGEAGLPVTEAGLRLKAEIEKIREQVQNLE